MGTYFIKVAYTPNGNYTLQMMEQLESFVYFFSRNFTIRGLDINDTAQELRYHIWRKANRYDPHKAGIRTWAKVVLRNKLIDMNRKNLITNSSLDLLDIKGLFPLDDKFI